MALCCWRLCKYVDGLWLLASLYGDVFLLLAFLCGCLFVVGVSMWMSLLLLASLYVDAFLLLVSLLSMWMSCGCWRLCMWMSFCFGVFVSMWMSLSTINGARYKLDGLADVFNNVSVIYCAARACVPPHPPFVELK